MSHAVNDTSEKDRKACIVKKKLASIVFCPRKAVVTGRSSSAFDTSWYRIQKDLSRREREGRIDL